MSSELKEEYKNRGGKENCWGRSVAFRSDPILIEMYHDYQIKRLFTRDIEFVPIMKELLPYTKIREYDGLENYEINYAKAKEDVLERFLRKVREKRSVLEHAYDDLEKEVAEIEKMRRIQDDLEK